MTFRKTKREPFKFNKKKTLKRKIGGSRSEDIFTLLDNTILSELHIDGTETHDERNAKLAKKEAILKGIDNILNENKDIQIVDTDSLKKSGTGLFNKLNVGSDQAIEKLGSWLIPSHSTNKKKNVTEISVLFYPSLIKSKKDAKHPNKPKLRFGNIMIKYNNRYADISNYFKSMFRQTDDAIATIRRGYTHNVKPNYVHKEKITSIELLEDEN